MKIYELVIGDIRDHFGCVEGTIAELSRKPAVSFVKYENDDLLRSYIGFNSTGDRIYIDYNIVDDLDIFYLYETNKESKIENLYSNNTNFQLDVTNLKLRDSNIGDLYINKSSMTTLPNITSTNDNIVIGDDMLVSIAFDTRRFSLVKTYNESGETILTRYSTRDQYCSAVMKFNSSYNNLIRTVTIYLFDKIYDSFVKFVASFKNGEHSFGLFDYDESDAGYFKVASAYKPERVTSFKLKFDTVPTRYVIYDPAKIDKGVLLRRIENQTGFTPILISWEKIGGHENIENLITFMDNSLVSRHVRSITLYGIEDTIPFSAFKNMKNVFFVDEIGKVICVKSS